MRINEIASTASITRPFDSTPVGKRARIEQQIEKMEGHKRGLLREFEATLEDDASPRDPKLVLKLGGIIELMIMALRQQLDDEMTLVSMADDPKPPLCATITKSGLTYQSRRSSTAAISGVGRCA
jgi:hypothetical protein